MSTGLDRPPRGKYDPDRLYCVRCAAQPEYFHEVMAWQVNRVEPDGTHIEMKDGEVMEYTCPECDDRARWGWELNSESKGGRP